MCTFIKDEFRIFCYFKALYLRQISNVLSIGRASQKRSSLPMIAVALKIELYTASSVASTTAVNNRSILLLGNSSPETLFLFAPDLRLLAVEKAIT